MREYGQIQSAFWQSPDAQSFSDAGKLLAAYLMTGPHTNGLGCFRLPDGYVMADLGWSSEMVTKGFAELFAKGFANRFDGVVFIPNFLRWNRISNGNIAVARFAEFDALPKGESKSLAARAMLEFCGHWRDADKRVLETVCQTLSKGYANQNPTQPNPERTKIICGSPGGEPPENDPPERPKDSPDPEPPTKPICLTNAKAERLAQVTREAIETFNARLGKPNGQLAAVHLANEVRQNQIKRCLPIARQICEKVYNSQTVTPQFWTEYWDECDKDPFKRGDGPYSGSHANWRPDFEYLTRKEVMTAVFDKAMSEQAA